MGILAPSVSQLSPLPVFSADLLLPPSPIDILFLPIRICSTRRLPRLFVYYLPLGLACFIWLCCSSSTSVVLLVLSGLARSTPTIVIHSLRKPCPYPHVPARHIDNHHDARTGEAVVQGHVNSRVATQEQRKKY